MPLSSNTLFKNYGKEVMQESLKSLDREIIVGDLEFSGYNEDLVFAYYWHLNFAYLKLKGGYEFLKLEDYHYFTENNPFGAQQRQMKGGSIRAYQENMQQLIQLVKVHLMPLLDEVKTTEYYHSWLTKITANDELVQQELAKSKPDQDKLKKLRAERNEAIRHIKDKWVSEIDGGKMWQLQKPAAEQGLDFSLLPQLFYGVDLDDPLQTKKTLKEQLDADIYPIDISLGAKEQVARFMYRFYTWLPSAIREANVTFRVKISTLKSIYAQIQMYVQFMKPILKEIAKKSEGLEKGNFFKNFEDENADFVNMLDFSYMALKVMGFRSMGRLGLSPAHLEWTKYGFYLSDKKEIMFGGNKGKLGYIVEVKNTGKKEVSYGFLEAKDKFKSDADFKTAKSNWDKNPVYVPKKNLRLHAIQVFDFSQKRKPELYQTPQGVQAVPHMQNKIKYLGYTWNLVEVAAYRFKHKNEDFDLIASLVGELDHVRDDLEKYANYLEGVEEEAKVSAKPDKKVETSSSTDLLFQPFKEFFNLFSVDKPFGFDIFNSKNDGAKFDKQDYDFHVNWTKVVVCEDMWKTYGVFKKSNPSRLPYGS